MLDEGIFFADCEGDNFLPDLTTMWTLQIAERMDGEIEVFADQSGYRPISIGLEILKKAPKIVFHFGMGFDLFAINKLYPGTLRWEQIIDSVVLSRMIDSTASRHNLKDIGEALGLPKGDHKDFSKFTEEMAVYGKQDVKIIQEAWRGNKTKGFPSFGEFYHKYPLAVATEMQTAYICQKQTNHGFRFDYKAAESLEATLRQEQVTLERELQVIFPPITTKRVSEKTGKPLKDDVEVFNPGSRQQIAKRLITKYKWKPLAMTPSRSNPQPKIDETILEALPYPEAQAMARYMHLGKKLGMIVDGDNSWMKLAKELTNGDYYIYGQINTLGARTHRMSHFKPNVAQADSDPRMRSMWLADPDWDIVGVDAEGLELRELAHFLEPYDKGRYIEIVHSGDKKKGTDIHTMNMKAAKLFLRDSAKTMIYAHNYGCGDAKLGIIVTEDAKSSDNPIPPGSLSKLGLALRKEISVGIVGLGELIEKCKRTHHQIGSMPGHDKRWIPSASDRSALNTLLQGNGSIVMKKALCIFDDEVEKLQIMDKLAYCANVHDEFQITCHPDVSQIVAETGKKAITLAGLALDVRCPLVGDAKIGKNWAETH